MAFPLQLCSALPVQLYMAALLLEMPAFLWLLLHSVLFLFLFLLTLSLDLNSFSTVNWGLSFPAFPSIPFPPPCQLPPGLAPLLGEVIAQCVSLQTCLISALLSLDYKCSCWQSSLG